MDKMTHEFRLFVSINLTPELLATLTDVQDQLKHQLAPQPLRWARPEGIHLTLKFLGDTETGRIETIVRALTQAVEPHQPFDLGIGGLGCFPNQRKPRVLWVGVHDPDDHLRHLAASVDNAMVRLGWKRENRPYTGHLTLARVKKYATNEDKQALSQLLDSVDVSNNLGTLPVQTIHLMRSQLQSGGTVYTSLIAIPLKAS
jgi:RNA 2',3'-cyclic 3'-phosphodiesterase